MNGARFRWWVEHIASKQLAMRSAPLSDHNIEYQAKTLAAWHTAGMLLDGERPDWTDSAWYDPAAFTQAELATILQAMGVPDMNEWANYCLQHEPMKILDELRSWTE